MSTTTTNYRLRATDNASGVLRGVRRQIDAVNGAVGRAPAVSRSWNKGLSENRRAIQQLGFQMTDFSVQIAGGQNALLAFIQQGGQMLQVFGPMGAIAAATLTVFGTLALVMGKTGKSLADITPIMGVLEEQLTGWLNVARAVGQMFIGIANIIVNNLDTIVIMATIAAGMFATRWVASVVVASVTTGAFSNVLRATALSFQLAGTRAAVATLATSAFTTAIGVLRTALLRLGIPALVLGLAFLLERFLRLTQVTGGVGAALKLLGEIATAVFKAIPDMVSIAALKMASWFLERLGDMAAAFNSFGQSVADGLNSLFNTDLKFTFGADVARDLQIMAATAGNSALALERNSQSIANMNTQVRQLRDLMKETPIDVRDWFGGAGDAVNDATGGGGDAAETEAKRIEKIFEDMSSSISKSLMDSFKGLVRGTKTLGDAVMSVLDIIMDKMAQAMLAPMFDHFATGLSSVVMRGFGFNAPMPVAAGGGRALGGKVFAGKAYDVGEHGRERFIPSTNGTVVPNHKMGGDGTVVTVNNYGQDNARVERSTGPDGREMVNVIVGESMSRGRFDQAQRGRYGNNPNKVKR